MLRTNKSFGVYTRLLQVPYLRRNGRTCLKQLKMTHRMCLYNWRNKRLLCRRYRFQNTKPGRAGVLSILQGDKAECENYVSSDDTVYYITIFELCNTKQKNISNFWHNKHHYTSNRASSLKSVIDRDICLNHDAQCSCAFYKIILGAMEHRMYPAIAC